MLRITRPRQPISLLGAVSVALDGKRVARLLGGQSRDVQGSGQTQTLTVSLNWLRSNPVTVADPGADAVLHVTVRFAPFWRTCLYSLFAPSRVLIVERDAAVSRTTDV